MIEAELSEDDFIRFVALIYRVSGVRIPSNKRVMITNRLRRRLRATGLANFTDYYLLLNSAKGQAEMPLFLDEVTTHETYFFRDVHHFEWFGSEFLTDLALRARGGKRTKSLKVWSAACSTGEEIYSLAFKMAEKRASFLGWDTTLLGTDLSTASVAAARAGRYDARSLRRVGLEDRKKWFDPVANAVPEAWTVKPEIKAMTKFKHHNLLMPFRDGPFDCVFIKNVLIYFDLESKKTAVKHLLASLAKGGYLVVGPTEGIFSMLSTLEKVKPWLYRMPA
ncbi:MAG: protein-glutamate O-methyltransferase CheR [Isosphaeraceae bacterium]|nr:protein-glutamate O-methyltransferase CheR [Isosphaeraceae bacterium]